MGTSNGQTENEQNQGNEEANPGGTSVEAFFAASVILITGATGFLGKVLLEKLLRSCPRIATIYILIRPKRNLTTEQRFQSLFDNPVFDRIRWECPSAFNKVIPIKGDVSEPDLGLSEEDRLMLTQRVNIVFHSAATVRFDEPLKVAVIMNTRGTDRVIELCSSMINLISFVHVSTAYSNADKVEIREAVYNTVIKPEIAIEMCENLDDDTLDILEKKLKGKHPNTYTLTKGLAENIVMRKGVGLPIAIVRPSIVCAAYKEPFPGWIDNLYGVTGIMMEIGRGTMRSIVCNENLMVDVIPADYVVDTLICAAWHNAMRRSNTIQVYNCVSGTFNPITWKDFGALTKKHAIELPTKSVIWYPGLTFRTNKFMHIFMTTLFRFLPAFIVDLVLKVVGKTPTMMKNTKRFERHAKTGQFFTVNEFTFHVDNMRQLIKDVKIANDANNFDVDVSTLDWDDYMQKYTLGIRKNLFKDSPDTLTNARSRLLKLYWIHKCTQVLVGLALLKMASSW